MNAISWLRARFYDAAMHRVEATCLGEWRRSLLAPLSGRVLEIGAGTGVNMAFYTDRVSDLILCEPDRYMRERLLRASRSRVDRPCQVVDAAAEALPFPDAVFDAAVATLVLCSVERPAAAVPELARVLKPGGTLVVIEHVVEPDRQMVRRWQTRIEPVWKRVAGNCHLTRDTVATLQENGFDCSGLRRERLCRAPAFVRPVILGHARRS